MSPNSILLTSSLDNYTSSLSSSCLPFPTMSSPTEKPQQTVLLKKNQTMLLLYSNHFPSASNIQAPSFDLFHGIFPAHSNHYMELSSTFLFQYLCMLSSFLQLDSASHILSRFHPSLIRLLPKCYLLSKSPPDHPN
jgi:hypothetical protein